MEFLKRDKWPLEGSGVGGGGDGWGRRGGGTEEGVGRDLGAGLAPGGLHSWPPADAGVTGKPFQCILSSLQGFSGPLLAHQPPGFKLSRGGWEGCGDWE